jgi:3-methyladenine DNA glycosylase/8-oxoguanine DNA glycosylase
MVELAVRPRGPYSLELSARLAGDATRRMREGLVTARCCGAVARAWQSPDGTVTIRSESAAAAEKLRWVLAVDDDHSEFLRRVADDPLLGRASKHLRGLRPVRTATVAQALLRAVCGQLVDWKTGRDLERRVIRALRSRDPSVTVPGTVTRTSRGGAATLYEPPTTAALASFAPFELRRLGLHERRGAALVRLCRGLELERLHDLPTDAVVRRIERERGLGPWSAGVVCLEGLGRGEHGLVGDLGLVKLLRALRGRPVEAWETAELLEPYGEWAGLASIYLLAGLGRGLIPLPTARAA